MKTTDKKIYLVDSGLSFNLPFPLVLRPQRGIQIYLTMDFSSRPSDSTPPFRELLLAEKWARLHSMPFPPVREAVKAHLDSPIKECYVFKEEDESEHSDSFDDDHDEQPRPECPVVIFFPMVNADFKTYK